MFFSIGPNVIHDVLKTFRCLSVLTFITLTSKRSWVRNICHDQTLTKKIKKVSLRQLPYRSSNWYLLASFIQLLIPKSSFHR